MNVKLSNSNLAGHKIGNHLTPVEIGVISGIMLIALAILAVGVTSLAGIYDHLISPLQPLTSMGVVGAGSLIGLGLGILTPSLIYLIVKEVKKSPLKKYYALLQPHLKDIFDHLHHNPYALDNGKGRCLFLGEIGTSCPACIEYEKDRKTPCTDCHPYAICIKEIDDTKRLIIIHDQRDKFDKLFESLQDNYNFILPPKIDHGICWTTIETHHYFTSRMKSIEFSEKYEEKIATALRQLRDQKNPALHRFMLITVEESCMPILLETKQGEKMRVHLFSPENHAEYTSSLAEIYGQGAVLVTPEE